MEELKKLVIDNVDALNQKWVEKIKAGEKSGGIDLTEMFGEFSIIVKSIDKAFREAEERSGGKTKKKGFLGF